jgi:hypothetical protein
MLPEPVFGLHNALMKYTKRSTDRIPNFGAGIEGIVLLRGISFVRINLQITKPCTGLAGPGGFASYVFPC